MIGASRIHGTGYREAIAEAFDVIGPTLTGRLSHVQFVCGVDPVFAGIHTYDKPRDGGLSFRITTHCAWPYHLAGPADRRVTTIVVPEAPWHHTYPLWLVHDLVHELGHALDWLTGQRHDAVPVTQYARTNRREAYAEAFVSWCWPGNGYDRPDPATVGHFRNVVRS